MSIFLFCITGCATQDDFEPTYNVPDEFRSIVETFIEEAGARGYDYEISNLIIQFDDDLDPKVCGQCNSISTDQNIQKIILINSEICWMNDFQKEALIFHELGHCVLGRPHDEASLPNGDPKSMMVKNNISIYSPCIYAFGNSTDCDHTFKRTYYLDELFDESTEIPNWAN